MTDARLKERHFLAGPDAGCIAQHGCLFCASAGLATVVRGQINRPQLAWALDLSKIGRIALGQIAGYPAAS